MSTYLVMSEKDLQSFWKMKSPSLDLVRQVLSEYEARASLLTIAELDTTIELAGNILKLEDIIRADNQRIITSDCTVD